MVRTVVLPTYTFSRLTFFPGIALFTYHKYRKSMDLNISLDASGNPVTIEDGVSYSGLVQDDIEELRPLTVDDTHLRGSVS